MKYNEIRLYVINYFYGFKNYSMIAEEEDSVELKDIVIVDFELLWLFFANTRKTYPKKIKRSLWRMPMRTSNSTERFWKALS